MLILLVLLVALALIGLGLWRSAATTPALSEYYRQSVTSANPHWRQVRRFTLATTFGRDIVRPWLRADEVHHLTYRRLGVNELPLRDVVPLSHGTHEFVTRLSRLGLRWPVNVLLRLIYAAWLGAEIYAIAFVLRLVGLAPFVPDPPTLVHEIRHAIEHFALSLNLNQWMPK